MLQVRNLVKSFGDRLVVRGIDLEVREGEVVGVLGPNGAGKTTCFSMIAGLVKPDDGDILLNGISIRHLPIYQRARLGINYLPQDSSVFRGLNVEQNIMAVLELTEDDAQRRREILEMLLGDFNISHLRHAMSTSLSGGERRRLEIARALAAKPHFLLLDEPLAGVDPIAVHDLQELLIKLTRRGIGILMTDHNVQETLQMVDRAYIISDGLVLRSGTPAHLVIDAEVRRIYLGERFYWRQREE